MKNVAIAQAGGPTSVINASLCGVINACRDYPTRVGRVYAACHGVEGLLREELLDLSAQPERELELLRTTPAAGAIGTCRYKIEQRQVEDLNRIVDVLSAHSIGMLFYIGGNDSMDTANRVSELARRRGLGLACIGIPKTIDNDLGDQERRVVDHTPGYGSVARYWADLVLGLNEENAGCCTSDPVLVVQAMGRRVGFIPAAARLADPERRLPLQIYMAESGLSLGDLIESVNAEVRRSKRVLVIVSEGFDVGSVETCKDAFGHVQFGASHQSVAQIVVNALNGVGLSVRGSARGQVPGTEQRHSIVHASTADLEEAFGVAQHAVELAVTKGTGYMATIERLPGTAYRVAYGEASLTEMANSERRFPKEWIAPSGLDVTDEFVAYARPLIGDAWPRIPLDRGLPRFARLLPAYVTTKCRPYVPQAYREGDR